MSTKRILITGGSGALGSAITEHVRDYQTWAPTRQELNVTVHQDWRDAIASFDPTEIWHFAAETAPDSEGRWYLDTNIMGTAYATMFCQMYDLRLVYTSTDYVFGNTPDNLAPYMEDSPMSPWNDYAWSKLGGEACVRMMEDHLIVRGSWYGDDAFSTWEYAATDTATSKYYVRLAARDISSLALSGICGVVHVGMNEARDLYHIAHIANHEPKRGTAAELGVPRTTALDTTLCQETLKKLPGQQSATV